MSDNTVTMERGWCLHVLASLFLATAMAVPVMAIPTGGGDGDGTGGDGGDTGGGDPITCLWNSTASFSAVPADVEVGQSTTLHWTVTPAPGCGAMTQSIVGIGAVEPSGSMTVQVNEKRTWTLQGWHNGTPRVLATTSVITKVPQTVTISSDSQVWLFLQAIQEPNTKIEIQNHVKLDLSGKENLVIKPGVTISGGRSDTNPGPLLFTNTFPRVLFAIGGGYASNLSDSVGIRGIRLQGAELGVAKPETSNSTGITIYSSANVDISHCEIMGWRGSGIDVRDPVNRLDASNFNKYELRFMSAGIVNELPNDARSAVVIALVNTELHIRILDAEAKVILDKMESQLVSGERLRAFKQRLTPLPNEAELTPAQKHEFLREAAVLAKYTGYSTVRVHDNYIHHNQRLKGQGYGVSVHDGGYALIDNNVFNYNRHALAAQGKTQTGYYAERNLVLTDGGWHYQNPDEPDSQPAYTHMLDVHGSESCWGADGYCGTAGEHFEFRDNTILYDHGTGIKLRGRPSHVAVISGNVFSHNNQWGGYYLDGAMAQTSPDGNLIVYNNTLGMTFGEMHVARACDFNRDGIKDDFLATGATWWYLDGNHADHNSWHYLNTSKKRKHQVRFEDVTGDGVCDVIDNDGVVFKSGILRQEPSPTQVDVPYVIGDTLDTATSTMTTAGLIVGKISHADSADCQYLGVVSVQSPSAGKRVDKGTAVNLTIGQRPRNGCVGQPQ